MSSLCSLVKDAELSGSLKILQSDNLHMILRKSQGWIGFLPDFMIIDANTTTWKYEFPGKDVSETGTLSKTTLSLFRLFYR